MPILDDLPAGDFEPLFYEDHSDVVRKAGEHSVSWVMRKGGRLLADTCLAATTEAARSACRSQVAAVQRKLEVKS